MRFRKILKKSLPILIFVLSTFVISCKDSSDVTEENLQEFPIVGNWLFSFSTDYFDDHENERGQVLYRQWEDINVTFSSDLTVEGFLPEGWGTVTYSYVSGGFKSLDSRRLKITSGSSAEVQLDEDWILTFTAKSITSGIEFYDVTLTNGGDDQEPFATARYYAEQEVE